MSTEIFGSIVKEELVQTVETGILPNTLVLENQGQFPGYYGVCCPIDELPDSIFLVTQQMYPIEDILRASQKIKKQVDFILDGTAATVETSQDLYHTIRIKGINHFDQIGEIQKLFMKEGFEFAKLKKMNELAHIKVQKLFIVEHLTPVIYKANEKNTYYLVVHHNLDWNSFKEVTHILRNNINISAFDAGLAVFYGSEILNLVRIYTDKLSVIELEMLRLKYDEIIQKLIKEGTIKP